MRSGARPPPRRSYKRSGARDARFSARSRAALDRLLGDLISAPALAMLASPRVVALRSTASSALFASLVLREEKKAAGGRFLKVRV